MADSIDTTNPSEPDTGAFTAVEAARMLVAVYGHPRWKPTGLEAQALLVARKFLGHRVALMDIRDHWATDYSHPKANTEMYRGPYGIGIVDGHRACANIARAALADGAA
jgi:hypothetical protein